MISTDFEYETCFSEKVRIIYLHRFKREHFTNIITFFILWFLVNAGPMLLGIIMFTGYYNVNVLVTIQHSVGREVFRYSMEKSFIAQEKFSHFNTNKTLDV